MDAGGVVRGLGFRLRITFGEFIGVKFNALRGETLNLANLACGLRADDGGAAGRFTGYAAVGATAP